ncbi:hypothetical protein [Methylobacterium aquaticum]|uniref:hypothetical protein n=1 Tax=Methylobacterium aquaticum TaxID=270351 RepID=UPI00142F327A|nr:hypothetical protein [Methylobacterium aquaticum]
MSTKPSLPDAQAPVTVPSIGTMSPEWFRFMLTLLKYAADLERRITTLETK